MYFFHYISIVPSPDPNTDQTKQRKMWWKLFLQSWTWKMRNLADEFSQVSKGDISHWYMGGRVSFREKVTCPLPKGHFWVDDISFSPGGIRDRSLLDSSTNIYCITVRCVSSLPPSITYGTQRNLRKWGLDEGRAKDVPVSVNL